VLVEDLPLSLEPEFPDRFRNLIVARAGRVHIFVDLGDGVYHMLGNHGDISAHLASPRFTANLKSGLSPGVPCA
jgi:hypothetical protein